ncbi:RagB/SusD family nutrient uptake outer membrane protein [Chitinophaga alhagiae]|uniref:RagB/SusD family nutrient uptake outer membrane protein n=1 Tax=Chitinophaga alhagiae TaxID=2203219 RepID=UPI000E5A29EF|nr:RagB/SusD family nutrient uptake outer membrane protein [Chitinophaga alhagiae]
MKLSQLISGLVLLAALTGCSKNYLEREIPVNYGEDEIFVSYERMSKVGYGVYTFLFNRFGFHRIDNAMLASASDEADHADVNSSIQRYNMGIWNAASNPEDCWAYFYQGIRRANLFLENSTDYKNIIYRDTIDAANKAKYEYNVRDIEWLRAEVRFLRAFYHFELIKRYGGVPIMEKATGNVEELQAMTRKSFDECVEYIVSECDAVLPQLKETWVGFDSERWRGRVTRGAALALKARLLLYAASPLHNPANDVAKWRRAAEAAHAVIALNRYSLHTNYKDLFRLGNGADGNPEVIFAQHGWSRNDFEMYNYPIGYDQGGRGSTSPSQNLVDAYDMKATGQPIGEPGSGYDPANPYTGRDPRLALSILTNNTTFKNRPVECWVGGLDGLGKTRATTTGYYLRKFVDEGLNLAQNQSSMHTWILFRYAEVLLNYAEAMNEAYGPETTGGMTLTAKKAVDMVRARNGIQMPPLPPGLSQAEMRERIRNERRVELAFEEHRFFDVRRWKIAMQTENKPIMAMSITRNDNNTFSYQVVKAEDRQFTERMYLYPIPEVEVLKSNGNLTQNTGW